MPVATLRIWRRRYKLTPRKVAPSENGLYSTSDAKRAVLLKQPRDLGHAIGTIVWLDPKQLRQVVVPHVSTVAGSLIRGCPYTSPRPGGAPWSV